MLHTRNDQLSVLNDDGGRIEIIALDNCVRTYRMADTLLQLSCGAQI